MSKIAISLEISIEEPWMVLSNSLTKMFQHPMAGLDSWYHAALSSWSDEEKWFHRLHWHSLDMEMDLNGSFQRDLLLLCSLRGGSQLISPKESQCKGKRSNQK